MKKIISLFLIASMMVSVFAPLSALAAQKEFLISLSYNDEPTGAVPGNGALSSGVAKIVVTKENKDKAVELSGTATDSTLAYNVETSEKIVSMFVELEYKDDWSRTEFNVRGNDGKDFLLAYIEEDGTFYSGDTRLATGVPKNRKVGLVINYNAKRQKVSVYMGNKCLAANRYLGEGAYDHVAGFGIKVKGKSDAHLFVDNLAIYNGQNHINERDIPKKGFSSEAVITDEVTSSGEAAAVDEFVGDSVYTNRTFDEPDVPEYEGATINTKTNKIAMDKSVFDGNKYLRFQKKANEESFISFRGNQTARYLVWEVDLSTENNTPGGTFKVRDEEAKSMFDTLLKISTNSQITTNDNRFVAKLEPLKWVSIALAFNMNHKTMNIYVDGEMVIKEIPLKNQTITGLPILRIYCDDGANTGTILVDNVRIYEGKEPRDLVKAERKSKVIPDSVAQGILGTNKAISTYSNTYYTDKEKYETSHKIILEEEDTMCYVHEEELKKMFGEAAFLKNPHSTEAGYYDALETAKANGFLVTNLDTRLYIFSRTPFEVSDDRIMEVYRYLFNVRLSVEELLEAYKQSDNYQKHPRILMDSEKLEEIKSLYQTDPTMHEWGNNVIKRADEIMGEPNYTYPLTGSDFEQVSEAVNDIVEICLAYHLTGNERYVGRVWSFIKNVCDLRTWNPYGYLDVAELCYVTAIGYDWLYYQWTEEQRKFIEETLYDKGVHLTYRLYHGELDGKTFVNNLGNIDEYYTGWFDGTTNWTGVCNGGTMCGALALLDVYPEVAAEVVKNTMWGLEHMMPSYYPEGAWEEGAGYWTYALSYVVRVINSLRNTFNTDFRLAQYPGLESTGWYGNRMAGSTGNFTISDGGGGFSTNPHVMWCANEYKDKELMAMRMQDFELRGHRGGASEMIYFDPELLIGRTEPALDTFMEGMEVIVLREAWYDTGTTAVGLIGGVNGRGHGHYDTGSYQIDMAGERFIMDLGAENYEAQGGYFSKNRYQFYRSRPEGHNMYIINPDVDSLEYMGIVPGSRAEGELLVSKPRGAIGIMHMTDVYAQWVSSATRGVMLGDDRRSVTVRDEIELLEPDSEIYYSVHTRANIEKLNDNQLLLSLNGKKMLVTLVTDAEVIAFEEAEAATISNVTKDVVKDTSNFSQGRRKFIIKAKGTGRVTITLKYKQYDDMMIDDYPVEGDISTWTIPDGEPTPLPVADAIYIDGKLVEGFDSKVTGYSYLVATKETVAPTVTVDTNLKYEIIPTPTVEGDTIVKVYAEGRDDVYRAYRINFWKKPPLQDIDGMRRYPIANVSASDIPEEENTPDKTFDMDFGTRWAADSTYVQEQWLLYELDDTYPIEKIGVSWMNGTARHYKYILEISVDGKNWTKVFEGESTGTTVMCEYTEVGGRMAKYVRYTGLGNSENNWNSITEVEILGNQR